MLLSDCPTSVCSEPGALSRDRQCAPEHRLGVGKASLHQVDRAEVVEGHRYGARDLVPFS